MKGKAFIKLDKDLMGTRCPICNTGIRFKFRHYGTDIVWVDRCGHLESINKVNIGRYFVYIPEYTQFKASYKGFIKGD